ncbi:MAG: hypothetical protein IH945_05685 [Armatimonadetes bacterium]|nr:hypothetical protein [Armatimonadota bacterium]
MRRVLLPALAASACAFSYAQEIVVPDVLVSGERALAVHRAELIIGQDVTQSTISDDGRYVVALRMTPSGQGARLGQPAAAPSKIDLVVWDSRNKTIREIGLPTNLFKRRVSIRWLTGSHVCAVEYTVELPPEAAGRNRYVYYRERQVIILLLNADNGRTTRVFASDPDKTSAFQLEVSPTVPRAVVTEIKRLSAFAGDDEVTISVIRPNGSREHETRLPDDYHFSSLRTAWTPDGRTLLLEILKTPEGGGRFVPRVLHYDLASGEYYDVKGPVPTYKPSRTQRDIDIVYRAASTEQRGVTKPIRSWWLTSMDDPDAVPVIIAEHAEFARLSPDERYALYRFKGAMFVRQIEHLTAQQYRQFLTDQVKKETMQKAKQVALALLMYAADYDDEITTALNFPKDVLPYMRSFDTAEGFVYTFTGGLLTDSKDVTKDSFGYFDTPYGRATAYLDGHVEWEEKRAPSVARLANPKPGPTEAETSKTKEN